MPETITVAASRRTTGHPGRTVPYSTPECAPPHFHALPLARLPRRVSSSQRTGVDLNSYADLAVRLVNSTNHGRGCGDGLATVESYRALVADRPHLAGRVTAVRPRRAEAAARGTAADLRRSGRWRCGPGRRTAQRAAHPAPDTPGTRQPRQPAMAHSPGRERVGRRPARGGRHCRADRAGHRVRHRPVRDLRSGRLRAGIYRDRHFRGKALLLRRMQAQGKSAGFAGPRAGSGQGPPSTAVS